MTKDRTPDEYLGYHPDLVAAVDRVPDGSTLRRRSSEDPPDPEYEKEKEQLRRWQVITAPPGFLEEALAVRKAQREAAAAGRAFEPGARTGPPSERPPRDPAEFGGIRSLERPEVESTGRRGADAGAPSDLLGPRGMHPASTPSAPSTEWSGPPHPLTDPVSQPTRPGVPIALAAARNAAGDSAPHIPMNSVGRAYKVGLALALVALVSGVVLLSSRNQEGGAAPPVASIAPPEPPRAPEPRAPEPPRAPAVRTENEDVTAKAAPNESAKAVPSLSPSTPSTGAPSEPQLGAAEAPRSDETPEAPRVPRRSASAPRRPLSTLPVAPASRPALRPTGRAQSPTGTVGAQKPAQQSDEDRVW